MAAKKNKLVSFRVTPEFKSLLERAAENECRSQANLLEKLLFDYCHRAGISAPVGRCADIRPARRGRCLT